MAYGISGYGNVPTPQVPHGNAPLNAQQMAELSALYNAMNAQYANNSVPNFAGVAADGYYPTMQYAQPEKQEGGLGFVGWTTIIGTLGAIGYGIKKGKFKGAIDKLKSLLPKSWVDKLSFKGTAKTDAAKYLANAEKASQKAPPTSPTKIDNSLPSRPPEQLTGEARKARVEEYRKLFK